MIGSASILLPSLLSIFLVEPPAVEPPRVEEERGASADNRRRDITLEQVQALQKAVEKNKALTEETRKAIAEDLQSATEQLKIADDWSTQIAKWESSIARAPATLAERKAELDQPPAEPAPLNRSSKLSELEQSLADLRLKLTESQKKVAYREKEPKRRADRRLEFPKLNDAARKRHFEILRDLDGLSAFKIPEQAEARRAALLARRKATEREMAALAKEAAFFDATQERLRYDRDIALRDTGVLTRQIGQLEELIAQKRREEVEAQREEAQRAAAIAHPAVKEIAEASAKFADRRSALAQKIEAVAKELTQTQKDLARLEEQQANLKKRVDTGGLTPVIGMQLRKVSKDLTDPRYLRHAIAARARALANIQLEQLDREAERAELADLDALCQQVVNQQGQIDAEINRDYVVSAIRESLEAKRDYLDALIQDEMKYFEKLIELDGVQRRLVDATEQFSDYIAERVLWVRSGLPLHRGDIATTWSAVEWLIDAAKWKELGRALLSDVRGNLALWMVAGIALVGLLAAQPRLRHRLRDLGERVVADPIHTFPQTLEAIGATVLIAAALPLLAWFIAWRLGMIIEPSDFMSAVSAGLGATATGWLLLEIARQFGRKQGVTEAHFRWRKGPLKAYRWNLYWLLVMEAPLVFLVTTMEASRDDGRHHSLGRLAFIAAMAGLSIFTFQVLKHRAAGATGSDESWNRTLGRWLDSTRVLWLPLVVASPCALAVMAGMGYYYTATRLCHRLLLTMALIWGVEIVNALVMRWLFIARGRLALEQAKTRRQATPDGATDGAQSEPAPTMTELSTVNLHTRRLLRFVSTMALLGGVGVIWADVLPALGLLERVELWRDTVKVTETVTDASGVAHTETIDKIRPITLEDLSIALALLLLTLVAGRNLHGFLEITLLARLPIDSGGRYAIATLTRYAITLIGISAAAMEIGIDWSNIQWLAAAFTVGLGFGLQEIFANFVSGLILLFERPIRVGDTISVGDMTGTITKIRIRATTILERSRKELVIPNKEFITGRLINWTLTDRSLKVNIRVGVVYGSNPEQVQEHLEKIALAHPLVLKEPAPSASFEGFGSSAMEFSLSVCVANVDHAGDVRHDLNVAIEKNFQESGIEIAYPHYDVRVIGWEGLPQSSGPSDSRRRSA